MPADDAPLPVADRLPIEGTDLQCRIAETAIELFYGQGAVQTTVRDITSACGLSPGALYNHFESKEHLLYVLIRDIHCQVDGLMAATLASVDPDPAVQLAAVVRLLVTHTADNKKRSRVANREFIVLTGAWREEISDLRRQMRERLITIMLAGAATGQFQFAGGAHPDSAALTSATITSMCLHISRWTLENYPMASTELSDQIAEMALRVAGARQAASSPGLAAR